MLLTCSEPASFCDYVHHDRIARIYQIFEKSYRQHCNKEKKSFSRIIIAIVNNKQTNNSH